MYYYRRVMRSCIRANDNVDPLLSIVMLDKNAWEPVRSSVLISCSNRRMSLRARVLIYVSLRYLKILLRKTHVDH